MQSITIQDIQKVSVIAQPLDAAGAPAVNFNPATWVSADPAIAKVENISADGLTADVVGMFPGTTTITVTGQQGDFQPTYSTVFTVVVLASAPTLFNFVFGTPVAK